MLYKYLNWDRKSVKTRSFLVYCFSQIFAMGVLATLFGGLNSLELVSDEGLKAFWEYAPISTIVVGIISGVVYMYRQMNYEIERLRDTCDHLSQSHSYLN